MEEGIMAHLTPYIDVVKKKDGKKVLKCSQCNFEYCDAKENFKLYSLVYDRDPKEIQPGEMGPDKDWMIYREFYCPSCGSQTEVEACPPGMPILHNASVKF